jgi:hypothetical protein
MRHEGGQRMSGEQMVYDVVMDHDGKPKIIEAGLSKERAEAFVAAAATTVHGIRIVKRAIAPLPWTAD